MACENCTLLHNTTIADLADRGHLTVFLKGRLTILTCLDVATISLSGFPTTVQASWIKFCGTPTFIHGSPSTGYKINQLTWYDSPLRKKRDRKCCLTTSAKPFFLLHNPVRWHSGSSTIVLKLPWPAPLCKDGAWWLSNFFTSDGQLSLGDWQFQWETKPTALIFLFLSQGGWSQRWYSYCTLKQFLKSAVAPLPKLRHCSITVVSESNSNLVLSCY